MLTMTRKLLLFAALLLAASLASAAPVSVTTTTTPETVFLFAVQAPAAAGKLPYVVVYWFDDGTACESMAALWSAKLAPTKVQCLPLSNLKAHVGEPGAFDN